MPWFQRAPTDQNQVAVAATAAYSQPAQQQSSDSGDTSKAPSIAAIAKSLLVTRRRLRLSPDKRLFFLYEPGKQVSSAVKIKNTSRSPVAFKFQTNALKSCFMRPPSGILAPGETVIAMVVKFIEPPEQNQERKCKDKFKIVSLKVRQGVEFVPELFDEQKEYVAVERVLRVVFLDPQSHSSEIEKLKKRLAEAEAAQQARKKPSEDRVQKTVAAGGVLDEWKEQQREKRLAKQQTEGIESP
ncbi:hypothetical protein GOP47_0006769 [Adiantum capillus-veneris]|uniref:MSP domain-containing protein n=1 Tax=Adiantum capillus-veneris TaxID=13818 RepID=A0A9D4ZMU2_ADICA|nr:hypothetical protein GOP47_0006221 [Adiantum capillus-veneris]KAI5079098.1 hypothetical protein GOP47_0006769 [Adiantum capillus-veneris]